MNRIHNNPIFLSVMVTTLASYFFSALAFIIPHWYAVWPGALSSFQNIGLWEICFYSFMQEEVYNKIYSDCFYIDYSGISDLKSWIVTNWFLASQILFTLNFASLMLASFVFIAMSMGTICLRRKKYIIVLILSHFIAWITCLITLILFGVGTRNLSEDQWMPNPDQCHLSWSYGSASLALLGSMMCLGQLFFVLKTSRNGLVFWSCSKSFFDGSGEDTMPIETGQSQLGPMVSIYDPRGGSSSKINTVNKDQSIISGKQSIHSVNKSKLYATAETESLKPGSQCGASLISEKPNKPLSVLSKTSQSHSQEMVSPLNRPSQYTKNPAKVTKSYSKEDINTSEPSKQSLKNPSKVSSPPASQLTISNISGTTSVIAAKPMKKK